MHLNDLNDLNVRIQSAMIAIFEPNMTITSLSSQSRIPQGSELNKQINYYFDGILKGVTVIDSPTIVCSTPYGEPDINDPNIQLLLSGRLATNFAPGLQFTITKYSNAVIDVNVGSIYGGTNVTVSGI